MTTRRIEITTSAAIAAICLSVMAEIPGGHGNEKSPLPAPLTDNDFYVPGSHQTEKVELGRLLFYDKILSGNLNISCASCHHALTGTGDGLSLPTGEGGRGLGVTRNTGTGSDSVVERVPRNSPALYNLGARQFRRMFHDGRVEVSRNHANGFNSPAGSDLPAGLDNVLAVQAMFPVTSATEMAGQTGENPQADAGDMPSVWAIVEEKLNANPAYVELFTAAFPDQVAAAGDIRYVHAANAISAYEAQVFRFDNSPFDQYLRGDHLVLTARQKRGMKLFYGKAGCAGCHSGALQTDHEFHAIAMPQVGPGKGDGLAGREDFGRERVTGQARDRFRFRTPSLRNLPLTAPYGHAGTYASVESVVRHHLNPTESLYDYDLEQLLLPSRADLDDTDRLVAENSQAVAAIAGANELSAMQLKEEELRELLAFLGALVDPAALDLRTTVPRRVPSGLPVLE